MSRQKYTVFIHALRVIVYSISLTLYNRAYITYFYSEPILSTLTLELYHSSGRQTLSDIEVSCSYGYILCQTFFFFLFLHDSSMDQYIIPIIVKRLLLIWITCFMNDFQRISFEIARKLFYRIASFVKKHRSFNFVFGSKESTFEFIMTLQIGLTLPLMCMIDYL